jgi:hypothetical protein
MRASSGLKMKEVCSYQTLESLPASAQGDRPALTGSSFCSCIFQFCIKHVQFFVVTFRQYCSDFCRSDKISWTSLILIFLRDNDGG